MKQYIGKKASIGYEFFSVHGHSNYNPFLLIHGLYATVSNLLKINDLYDYYM